ncbi:TatD family hydrolase [Pseudomonadota bacterium]
MIVDTHCHLEMLEESGLNIDEVLERAEKNGVEIVQTISSSMKEFPKVLANAEKYENVYSSVGLHPIHTLEEPLPSLEELIEYAEHPKIIGYGETGLDYHYEPFDKKLQKKNFEAHIEASRKTTLPIIIHSRDADKDMMEILESEIKNGEFKFLLHCYTSGKELAYKGLDLDGYISVSGVLTFKNAQNLRDIIKEVPLNRLMVETDAPYLAPVPHRGKMNEPAFTMYTAESLAELKNVSYSEVAKVTTDNFLRLFDKVVISEEI